MPVPSEHLVEELVEYFLSQNYVIQGARNLKGHPHPPEIRNDGFGDLLPRTPDVIGVDRKEQRIVFGLVRENPSELDSEQSLTDYNVFLDHKHSAGRRSSLLVVLLPTLLLPDFTGIITHYIHRDYWHRIVPVGSRIR